MPTKEMVASSEPAQNVPVSSATGSYTRPLAIVTTLFFMWGFLTSLNDILVPHLKAIFDLNYTRVMLVQFAFFSAYLLFSAPWSKIVYTIGYQKTMVVGLLTMISGKSQTPITARLPEVDAVLSVGAKTGSGTPNSNFTTNPGLAKNPNGLPLALGWI